MKIKAPSARHLFASNVELVAVDAEEPAKADMLAREEIAWGGRGRGENGTEGAEEEGGAGNQEGEREGKAGEGSGGQGKEGRGKVGGDSAALLPSSNLSRLSFIAFIIYREIIMI